MKMVEKDGREKRREAEGGGDTGDRQKEEETEM